MKNPDTYIMSLENKYDVLGIDSHIPNLHYFTDAEKTGLVLMFDKVRVAVERKYLKMFVEEIRDILEVMM